jgi:hypothetical protein
MLLVKQILFQQLIAICNKVGGGMDFVHFQPFQGLTCASHNLTMKAWIGIVVLILIEG